MSKILLRIGIYSPYLDTFGGGERYILTIAEFLSMDSRFRGNDNQVDFLLGTHLYDLDINKTKESIKTLHNLDLSKVNFIKAPIGKGSSLLKRLFFLRRYDVLFYLTDGSYFYSTAKKSIIHLQSPIKNLNQHWWAKFKLSSWDLIIYNSKFTQDETLGTWAMMSKIIYPPVDVNKFKPLKKKKQILSVGRFFGYLKDKKHEILINAFKRLVKDEKLEDWSLHLAGGAGEGDQPYIDQLKKKAAGYKVMFYPNISFENLKKLYGESQIYWHASGLGETDPTKMEHFGITTVEAMASGAVPVVINLGGQKEIVENCESGFLWNTAEELIDYTCDLIADNKFYSKLSKKAVERSKIFSKESFCREIDDLISYG